MSKTRFDFWIDSGRLADLHSLGEQTDESASEWIRRMLDYCMTERVLCELVPVYMSGQVRIGK